MISAYQLTFAAFLLLVRVFTHSVPYNRTKTTVKSGRISDVYSPKPAFVSGAMILALTHLGGGFVRQKIALLVLRALGGIGGALTIPSALSMIVALFPDQRSQGRAIAIFGGTGGVGNGQSYLRYKQLIIFTLVFNSPGIDYWSTIRPIHILAVDLLLYGDYGFHNWNHMLHPHPQIDKACLQGSFRLLRYCNTLL